MSRDAEKNFIEAKFSYIRVLLDQEYNITVSEDQNPWCILFEMKDTDRMLKITSELQSKYRQSPTFEELLETDALSLLFSAPCDNNSETEKTLFRFINNIIRTANLDRTPLNEKSNNMLRHLATILSVNLHLNEKNDCILNVLELMIAKSSTETLATQLTENPGRAENALHLLVTALKTSMEKEKSTETTKILALITAIIEKHTVAGLTKNITEKRTVESDWNKNNIICTLSSAILSAEKKNKQGNVQAILTIATKLINKCDEVDLSEIITLSIKGYSNQNPMHMLTASLNESIKSNGATQDIINFLSLLISKCNQKSISASMTEKRTRGEIPDVTPTLYLLDAVRTSFNMELPIAESILSLLETIFSHIDDDALLNLIPDPKTRSAYTDIFLKLISIHFYAPNSTKAQNIIIQKIERLSSKCDCVNAINDCKGSSKKYRVTTSWNALHQIIMDAEAKKSKEKLNILLSGYLTDLRHPEKEVLGSFEAVIENENDTSRHTTLKVIMTLASEFLTAASVLPAYAVTEANRKQTQRARDAVKTAYNTFNETTNILDPAPKALLQAFIGRIDEHCASLRSRLTIVVVEAPVQTGNGGFFARFRSKTVKEPSDTELKAFNNA
ncbi:MAG: hypothetical protein NTZ67_03535 [Gammaproteobacteria bacterium]|nr:hypothetical protein [Gammaproteobacteria bacterium]